jgi:hypothetical protein
MRCTVCLLLLCTFLSACAKPPLPGESAVQQEMQALITYLDSAAYGYAVPWGEHVVLAYRLAQGRDPSLLEYAYINMLREHPGLKRSDVLGIALTADRDAADWDACAAFLSRNKSASFKSDDSVKLVSRALAVRPREELAQLLDVAVPAPEADAAAPPKGTQTPGEEYETYYGFLHAHSHFSLDGDQSGTVDEAYTVARDAGGLDFFGLTDHAEFLILWPWDNKWERGRAAADAFDAPGEFVALWGFEWSNPLLGHLSIMNTEDFTHTFKTFRLRALYDWIAERPEAYAQFNHPGDYDFIGLELGHFKPYPRVAAQMVGLEVWNTDFGLDRYFYGGSWENDASFMDVGNQNGWMLGALGAQDNHGRDWGVLNDFRTGVLATELTREGIAEAFRARRFYATEDKDLALDFRCSGFPMGARLEGVARVFTVSASDGSGDAFQRVRLFKNGQLLDQFALSSNSISVDFEDTGATGDDYYYVIITQADDNDSNGRNDEALSSPIWVSGGE